MSEVCLCKYIIWYISINHAYGFISESIFVSCSWYSLIGDKFYILIIGR